MACKIYPTKAAGAEQLTAWPLHVAINPPAAEARGSLPLGSPRLPVGDSATRTVGTGTVATYRTGRSTVLRSGSGTRLEGPEAEAAQGAGEHSRLVRIGALARNGAWRSGCQSRGRHGVRLAEATCVLAQTRQRRTGHATHAGACVEIAGHGVGRAGTERPQIGEALGRAEIVGDRRAVRATRELQRRALSADRMRVIAPCASRLSVCGEVEGRCAAQATPVDIEADRSTGIRMSLTSGRRDMGLEDLNLPGVRIPDRSMLETHVVGEDMDLSALFRANGRREDQNLPGLVATEHGQLSVILESDGVVQVQIP